ncbi:LAFA_0E18272g1_1 [Lachancea sp. 'fantastica']|nr:LAFA_0E18272g1_1 [Lachancea sp. 'fantastica']
MHRKGTTTQVGLSSPEHGCPTNSTGVVDLTSEPHRLPQLQACNSIAETRSLESPLFFDLSQCGIQLPLPNYTRVHLKFPSTLVRRPNFQFSQLAQTLDHGTQELLSAEVESRSVFVFYDEGSTLQNCSTKTANILNKVVPHLSKMKEQSKSSKIQLFFLQGGKTSLQQKYPSFQQVPVVRPSHSSNTRSSSTVKNGAPKKGLNKQNMNLKITIPNRDARIDNSNHMFIQSFKKDSIQYSPDSLKKYFNFHMPDLIEPQDEILPAWLKRFSDSGDKNLLTILNSFECLEKLEVKRLERCLQSSKQDSNGTGNGIGGELGAKPAPASEISARPKPTKLYSFCQMQKDYKPNRHDYDSDNDGYHQAEDIKLKMDINEELHDGENQEILTKLMKIKAGEKLKAQDHTSSDTKTANGNEIEKHDDDDEEIAETPMDNYLLTRGIQSYTKNRYSNILPYEHSRVKLEPSPIWPEQKSATSSSFVTPMSSPPLSNKAMRKRRNSYFSQEYTKSERTSNQLTDQESVNGRPPLHSASTSFDNKRYTKPTSENDQFNDYFNANYLKIPQINPDFNYIATQAPLPSTLDDFWKVVVSHGVKVILSLNSDDELSMRKWDIYWNSNALEKFDVSVSDTYENVCGVKGCILRVIEVRRLAFGTNEKNHPRNAESDKNNEAKGKQNGKTLGAVHTVCQLQYTRWLDSCGIVLGDVLKLHRIKNLLLNSPKAFVEDIRKGEMYDNIMKTKEWPSEKLSTLGSMTSSVSSPLLVHCSAGCGRTGVFITLDYLFNVMEHPTDCSNRIDVWNTPHDLIFIIVNELRKQRISMVQNLTQYITCYEAILKYFELRKMTGNLKRVH